MLIPMDRQIAVAYSKGIPIVEEIPEYKEEFRALYRQIKEKINH